MSVESGTWLCPDEQARARVLDNSPRVKAARTTASLSVGLAVLYAAPTYSWWLLLLFAVSMINTSTVDVRMQRARRPEYQAAFTIVVSQALMAAGSALTGGAQSPMLPLIVIPTAFVATRFRPRVCFVATAIAMGMLIAASLAVSPQETLRHPGWLVVSLVILVGIDAATQALFSAELQHRNTAILDPLTGLLNRKGLEQRFSELAEQARLMGAPISMLVCDLDHFKQVNDLHGHATGDAVLRDVAYALRKQLRSFELIYRLGGEEFLIVLPGATGDDAALLGQRLCDSVRECHTQSLELTISVGCATQWGPDLEFDLLFEAADRALYDAKAAGRDQVISAPVQPSSDPRAATTSAPA
jgi:diguanylate cyclase (GGDEF)-like protein